MSKPDRKSEAEAAYKAGARWDGSEWVYPSKPKKVSKKDVAKKMIAKNNHAVPKNIKINGSMDGQPIWRHKSSRESMEDDHYQKELESSRDAYWHDQQERRQEYGD